MVIKREIDLIVGKDNKGTILTTVKRSTRMVMIRKLYYGKNADKLANIVIDMLLSYKEQIKSITSDNGTEFTRHPISAKKLNTKFYFADTSSFWNRGLSEYTHKLIRHLHP